MAIEDKFGKVATSEDAHEVSETGAFVRQDNYFTTPFGSGKVNFRLKPADTG